MTMNKILLVLIVSSGFMLIFYANNDIFTRKKWFGIFQKDVTDPQTTTVPPSIVGLEFNQNQTQNNHLLVKMLNNQKHAAAHRHRTANNTKYNIFIIFTKENDILRTKFELFVKSLLKYSSIPLTLHIITDERSESATEEILKKQILIYRQNVIYRFYDVEDCAIKLSDITNVMMPHFSSNPGSYYSDALFYLSLGLHRIVDPNMRRAILIDCDVVFRTDVRRLFGEFDKFSEDNLFGLAPELTPVYRHILYKYRAKNPNTNFGNAYYPSVTTTSAILSKLSSSLSSSSSLKFNNNNLNTKKKHLLHHGYPGLNSGVVLMDFDKIRKSKLYAENLKAINVNRITKKYFFKGHLGDQDYYTLLGYEFPSLIYRLDCVWNRQLCTWWKDHGYSEIFDTFFHCEGKIRLYHGNCNTRIPE